MLAFGGDGTVVEVSPQAADRLYTQYQNGPIQRQNWNGSNLADMTPQGAANQLFVNPIVLDPNNPNILYYAAGNSTTTSFIWRNNDPGFANTTYGWTALPVTDVGAGRGYARRISALGISIANDPNVLYYGTIDGIVMKAVNVHAAPTVTNITPPGLNGGTATGGFVRCVAVDPTDSQRALVVFGNYNFPSLWYTTNGGTTWTDVEGNLAGSTGPSIRWATIFHVDGQLEVFLATSVGVLSTNALAGGATVWAQEAATEIGNVIVGLHGLPRIRPHARGRHPRTRRVHHDHPVRRRGGGHTEARRGHAPPGLPESNPRGDHAVVRSSATCKRLAAGPRCERTPGRSPGERITRRRTPHRTLRHRPARGRCLYLRSAGRHRRPHPDSDRDAIAVPSFSTPEGRMEMVKRAVGFACVVIALTIALASVANAQDSNYWSTAYGTRSQLLGGVVIGSPGDISAVFYNPGALALSGPTELLLAGNAYQYQKVAVSDGSGPGRSLISSTVSAVPSLFAGEIPRKGQDRIAYAFITRRSMDMELERYATEGVEAFAPIANPVFAATEIQLKQDFSETWYGGTWAHPLTPRIGIGVSPFVAVRSQNTRASALAEGQDASGNAAILTASREYDFLHFGLLARIGLSGARDSLTWGVTVTTPNLQVTGSGSTQYNTTLIDQTGTIGNLVGADYRKDLKAEYRTPLGAGAGASYGWTKTRIHAAVDWNAEVPRYTVLETPNFTVSTPSGDSTVRAVVSDQMESVLNWGIGIEHRFSPKWGGYASYHTDFSGRLKDDAPGLSMTRWDLQDVTIGSTVRVGRSDFALGLSGAFANRPVVRVPDPPAGGPAQGNLKTNVMLLTVVVGWKIAF